MNNIKRTELETFYDHKVWGHYTLDEYLEEKAIRYPNSVAIIDGEIEVTYESLIKEVKNYAGRMVADGIKEGDKVVVQLPNCLEFVIVIFALFKIGAKPVLALANHRKIEIKGVIKNSQAVAYIAKSEYLGFSYETLIKEIESETNYKLKKYILGNTNEYKKFYTTKRNDYVYQLNFGQTNNRYKDIALLLLSGGTTGIPKLIPRRHCDYIYVAEQSAKRCLLDENTIYLASLSMAHNFPLGCPGIIGTFSVGGTVVICNVTSPDEIFPLIEEHSVTHTALVPSVAKMCINFYKYNPDYDISSLKLIQVGGALLDAYTAKEIVGTLNCMLQQVYGIAEGLICMTSPKDGDEIIYETQGTPISEYDEIKIVDENGNEVPDGEFGELYVRGPYTIYNYYNDPNIKCIDENMYFMTGDKVCKQQNGRYKIAGRIKEMINKSGEKILPTEIEELLLTHSQIDDVKVIGIEDETVGEKICVCLKNETNLDIHDLRTYLNNHGLADFKLPDCIKTVNEWPLTSFGKIDIKKLKALIK
ncbi:AMP-binding protein [Staphylococcus felis]|uniref:Putative long chain fatty acid-CoA ligase VraA n=1 Tax=Staphylococcus felis TaxID=46127 RepID=A0ABS0QN98_9STAP|nr:AMP-binding protein [Staphylococcus felis]MBH9580711.1 AMP-binding protein [Staphylococcus felis]